MILTRLGTDTSSLKVARFVHDDTTDSITVPSEWERFQPEICLTFQPGGENDSTVPREWERFQAKIFLTL